MSALLLPALFAAPLAVVALGAWLMPNDNTDMEV